MNLILSYSTAQDEELLEDGHIFLGVGQDNCGSEVHVWLKRTEGSLYPLFNPEF